MERSRFIKRTAETLYGLLYPEVRRRIITEIAEPALVWRKLMPVERYDTKELKYYKVAELVEGVEQLAVEGGAAYPVVTEVIEEATVTLKRFGIAVALDDWDVRHANFAIMRRNLEAATRAMARFEDKEIISNAVQTATGINGFDVPTTPEERWDTDTAKPRKHVGQAIYECRADNFEPDTMIMSPKVYWHLLRNIDLASDWGARAALEMGAVPRYQGLQVIVSNNMKEPNNIIVCAKNKFGWLAEAIPIRSDTEYIKRTKTHYIYIEMMNGAVIDNPTAICEIRGVLSSPP